MGKSEGGVIRRPENRKKNAGRFEKKKKCVLLECKPVWGGHLRHCVKKEKIRKSFLGDEGRTVVRRGNHLQKGQNCKEILAVNRGGTSSERKKRQEKKGGRGRVDSERKSAPLRSCRRKNVGKPDY